jgi:hypothetical protein
MLTNALPVKWLRAIPLLLALILITACSHGPVVANGALSREQVVSDLQYIKMVVETAHPNPFFHEKQHDFEAALSSLESSNQDGTTPEQLYRGLAPIIAAVGDSHTNLDTYTKAYQEFRNGNGRLFPFELRVVNRRAFVTADYGPEHTIPVGAELTKVDGLAIPAFLDRLGRYVGAERVSLRDSFVADDVRAYMWHAGMAAPFRVGFVGRSRHEVTYTLRGTTIAAIHAWDNSNAGYDALTPFRLDYADNGAVGVLTIHSFDKPEGWRAFTQHLVGDMRSHGTRALVIDLRRNSGGNTDTSDALLSLLAHHKFRDFSQLNIKVSAVAKAAYSQQQYLDIYGSDAWDSAADTLLRQTVDWTTPLASQWAFPGKVFVLEGGETFSTAAIFTAAVQDCHVGEILGEESGGLPTLYGELFGFKMPASNLEGSVSTKFFVRPSGDLSAHGVIPDHSLAAAPPDAPTDPELEVAVSYADAHRMIKENIEHRQ